MSKSSKASGKPKRARAIAPLETEELYKKLAEFLNTPAVDAAGDVVRNAKGKPFAIGNYKWGVYAFFDYDDEPIYVGQTNESLRTRIRRHLTNQRTDAVAMSVLDPFEVKKITVWPLPEFEGVSGKSEEAKRHLDALERLITAEAITTSKFTAILNEKNPPSGTFVVEAPPSYEGTIVSDEVLALRSHPDTRIARRAMISARLAQVISEWQVQTGLRRVLTVQAKRLQWLAGERFQEAGGESAVETKTDERDG